MQSESFNDPITVFEAFRSAMRQWVQETIEERVRVNQGELDHHISIRRRWQKLREIFDEFVLYKGLPMRMSKEGGFAYNPHGEHDPETEKIVSVETVGNITKITTIEGIHQRTYTLRKIKDVWKLLDGIDHQVIRENPITVRDWL